MDVETTTPSPREIEALVRRIDRPVVLVGMMGVGKSTVGRKLASLLRLGFVDADDEIETAAQMTIPEIFDAYGEAYFRDGERRVIARLMSEPEMSGADRGAKVIATGGGAFVQPATRTLILERGIAVWLDSDVETLLERVSRKAIRPLLQGGDPRATLTRLSQERAAAYAEAPIRVESLPGPHQRTVLAILAALDRWL
jgi:shikimate kinase